MHPTTNKSPWITVDGEDVPDSQLAIEKLSKVFGKELSNSKDVKEQALAEAMRIMVEEHLYWILVVDRCNT